MNCPFCYLGKRAESAPDRRPDGAADAGGAAGAASVDEHGQAFADASSFLRVTEELLVELPYKEVAIAISEPLERWLAPLERLGDAARRAGRPLTITTTLAVARQLPGDLLAKLARLSLSIDPFKGQLHAPAGKVLAEDIHEVLRGVRTQAACELVLLVTLSTARFADAVADGLLAELLALREPAVDRVALSALKPPPPWCDRAFWMGMLKRLAPLLRSELDRRLFLDCYVAARLLGLGPCPARPDLSPAALPDSGGEGLAFRSCVYQAVPDLIARDRDELAAHLAGFTVPAVCPFPIV